MYSLAIAKFDVPGEPGFPLNAVYAKPSSPGEAGRFRIIIECLLMFISYIFCSVGKYLCSKPLTFNKWLLFFKEKFVTFHGVISLTCTHIHQHISTLFYTIISKQQC